MEKTLYQAEIPRLVLIYVFLGFLVVFFSIITYNVLRRRRQRLNLVISGFYISLTIAFVFNMIYAPLQYELTIKILNFLTNYFIFFGAVFLLIANLIILESTLIYSVKRQNRYILFYGILLFAGMLILVLLGEIFDIDTVPFLGVQIIGRVPKWGPIFFTYIVSIMTIFTLIPINYTNFKIYSRFETKALKRKWFYHLVGFLGLTVTFYLSCISNILDPEHPFKLIITVLNISLIIWGYMMYYGIGVELKK